MREELSLSIVIPKSKLNESLEMWDRKLSEIPDIEKYRLVGGSSFPGNTSNEVVDVRNYRLIPMQEINS
jgi:hypothetical protein